ncbi:hypothetical protein N7491_000650 [Penicillium cf. griseofulvum]|uniref:F-box domain-containing protein n=1 Tax=Penicillium cf. griseofulvum TaxID=2972120 RepID=A0A9W9IQ87_9EURO|nr:hypothetical protein N7472_011055 [Penicillium cf. griseofulvum]KAJ5451468.1 hypothetical protein N7491_000650 [Penicillium cf. griseofulvum]
MITQDTALETAEVLENILLYLDFKSILTSAQRVCHSWQDLISTSPSLQKQLFFRPDWARKDKERNPLLAEIFPGWFPDLPTSEKQCADLHIKDHGIEIGPDATESSWNRMLIQQTPIINIICFILSSSRGGTLLSGPYTTTGEDSRAHWFSVSDPLRVSDLLCQVPNLHETMVLWDNEDHHIPSEFQYHLFNKQESPILQGALEECGIILLKYKVVQCAFGVSGCGRLKRQRLNPKKRIEEEEEDTQGSLESNKRSRY